MEKHLRVLAIHGGGIRGLIPATILENLSKVTGKEIPELFDVIIGTSIGGILAAGYAAPARLNTKDRADVLFNATEVTNLIKNHAEHIFPPSQMRSFPSTLWEAKYSRESLDYLLEEKFQIVHHKLKLKDTLVPVALTSQNAVNDDPQIWFSCGKNYSNYSIADVAGATSAAPTYFPPKLIEVESDIHAFAENCKKYGLVAVDDMCYHKALDGGLFANAPTMLSAFLLNKVMMNEITDHCRKKYTIIDDNIPAVKHNLILEMGTNDPKTAPKMRLGDSADLTVVSLGTGHFTGKHSEDKEASWIEYAPIIASVGTAVLTLPFTYSSFIGIAISGGLAAGMYPFAKKIVEADDGYIGAIRPNSNIIERILHSNEVADQKISRDVFGSITINPTFDGQPIKLDATDKATLESIETHTRDYIENNQGAFEHLAACLLNEKVRGRDCDLAWLHFQGALSEATHHIVEEMHYKTIDTSWHEIEV